MLKTLLTYSLISGILCIIVGYYEYKLLLARQKQKILYKFVDSWEEEKQATDDNNVYLKFEKMFTNTSII
jgi:hypothetical protein